MPCPLLHASVAVGGKIFERFALSPFGNRTQAPTSMWRRLIAPFKEFGGLDGTLYLLDRVLQRLSPRLGLLVYELMVQPIGTKPLLTPNLVKNLTFVEIERGHPDVAIMPARPDIKERRFEQGANCLGVYRKGALIGYIWFCFARYEEDEVRCDYELAEPQRSVFDFDLVVMPEHRMGVGFMAVWHGANEYLGSRGIKYTFSRLTRFNVASRRAHAHLGWACIGRAVFLKAWSVELMVSTLSPYVAVTWSPDQRVRLRLSPHELTGASTPVAPEGESMASTAPTRRPEL